MLGCGVVDASCKFPFTYNGATYTSCTTAASSTPWCSTATDSSGHHIPGTGSYVDCANCTGQSSGDLRGPDIFYIGRERQLRDGEI